MSLSLPALKRLSFLHSGIYVCLLIVWLVPGLSAAEAVFGLSHGIGWIVMVLLILNALRAGVVSMRSGVAVAVLGGIGPFFGSWQLAREQRERERQEPLVGDRAEPQPTQAQAAR